MTILHLISVAIIRLIIVQTIYIKWTSVHDIWCALITFLNFLIYTKFNLIVYTHTAYIQNLMYMSFYPHTEKKTFKVLWQSMIRKSSFECQLLSLYLHKTWNKNTGCKILSRISHLQICFCKRFVFRYEQSVSHNLEMSGVLMSNNFTLHILPTDTPETIFDLYLRHKKSGTIEPMNLKILMTLGHNLSQ